MAVQVCKLVHVWQYAFISACVHCEVLHLLVCVCVCLCVHACVCARAWMCFVYVFVCVSLSVCACIYYAYMIQWCFIGEWQVSWWWFVPLPWWNEEGCYPQSEVEEHSWCVCVWCVYACGVCVCETTHNILVVCLLSFLMCMYLCVHSYCLMSVCVLLQLF